jgi:hypothetical protein
MTALEASHPYFQEKPMPNKASYRTIGARGLSRNFEGDGLP